MNTILKSRIARFPASTSTSGFSQRQAKKHRAEVRIASFNVQCAEKPSAISDAILKSPRLSDADVILLQEVEAHDHEAEDRAEAIARACGFEASYVPARIQERSTHGLAILSRIPVFDIEPIPLEFCDIGWRSRQRIGIGATLEIGSETVKIYNVHLDTRINASTRIDQLRPILEHASRHASEKVILAGDFNTMPIRWLRGIVPFWYENQRHAVESALLSRGFTERVEATGHTMRQGPIRFKLDSIYGKGVSITASGIEHGIRASDHHPLWADIEF